MWIREQGIPSETPAVRRLTDYTLRPEICRRNDASRLRSRFRRGQRLLDRCGHLWRIRRDFWFETSDDPAIRADEKLGEVPLNLAARLRMGRFVREELIERSDVFAFDGH